MEEKQKIKIDKSKLATNVLSGVLIVVISAALIWALVTIVAPKFLTDDSKLSASYGENTVALNRINMALNRIMENHIEDQDIDKLVDGAISGMADATDDPYTRYISEEEYQEMLVAGTEQYSGIGVHISYDQETKGIIILGIMPNSPAQEAGLKIGDIIAMVGDVTVNTDTYSECVDAIKGEENTTVKLTIVRNQEEVIEKEITRKKISVNNIESELLDNNIGYIRILAFENDIYKQFKAEYDKFDGKVDGLIIDLRNNSGGLVNETLNIADLLVPAGDALKLRYKDGTEKVYRTTDKNEINVPLVVLVNGRSASASEILAGIIKDTNKGVVIGTKTFGKGIVQTVEKLGDRGALSITTSKYYTPSGVEIHKNGIEPNITVELPQEEQNEMTVSRDKDTQLKRAVEYIVNGK